MSWITRSTARDESRRQSSAATQSQSRGSSSSWPTQRHSWALAQSQPQPSTYPHPSNRGGPIANPPLQLTKGFELKTAHRESAINPLNASHRPPASKDPKSSGRPVEALLVTVVELQQEMLHMKTASAAVEASNRAEHETLSHRLAAVEKRLEQIEKTCAALQQSHTQQSLGGAMASPRGARRSPSLSSKKQWASARPNLLFVTACEGYEGEGDSDPGDDLFAE